jgi:hypothetical protein
MVYPTYWLLWLTAVVGRMGGLGGSRVTIAACVDALAIIGQRAVAQAESGGGAGAALCVELAPILLSHLDSIAPPVRHAAAVGLQCIAVLPEVQAQAPVLLPKLLAACDDRSVVMDHCARAPATDAVTALVGGYQTGSGRQQADLLRSLVTARYTA